ncbi:molybdopterin/thiamine biosynthesis adenylyltransferase [Rhodobacter aestuarii]|uniref:Molybdopterin-synthase adenylyltransferase n=1 Tax=Rhodobacter aestuarii TaxID=453582 RepID=A0A1N7NC14_9RHOB|nr:HesA/MoeB/ThiF family protein [Rhodobacter aestuarii]PTV96365.1 molybdopterin/thiamine biosynthesis adenylyltransferase [Rhodobacter aestuarii]SIS95771.1 Molybdopterin or thiamine biosynthesis adenylyltransferase [Rhodobacter aestuarii]
MTGLFLLFLLSALGLALKVPRRLIWGILAVVCAAFVAAHALFAEPTHPLRAMIGGSLAGWVGLGVVAGVVLTYRWGLAKLRARAAQPEQKAPQGPFSEAELNRYARHILLREVGGPGQKRLKAARVLVVGAGGLGAPVLLYLGAAGVGAIGVIDPDTVSASNLQRQVLYRDADIGKPKVFAAQAALLAQNPFIKIRPYHRAFTPEIAAELLTEYDLVLDGTDNFETRQAVNRACVAAGKPLISGAIAQWEGQLSLYDPAKGAPCLACVFPTAPAPGLAPDCAQAGVMGALPGIIGAMMAAEAIKEIVQAGQSLRGTLLIHDALWAESRRIAIKRAPTCPVCSTAT